MFVGAFELNTDSAGHSVIFSGDANETAAFNKKPLQQQAVDSSRTTKIDFIHNMTYSDFSSQKLEELPSWQEWQKSKSLNSSSV